MGPPYTTVIMPSVYRFIHCDECIEFNIVSIQTNKRNKQTNMRVSSFSEFLCVILVIPHLLYMYIQQVLCVMLVIYLTCYTCASSRCANLVNQFQCKLWRSVEFLHVNTDDSWTSPSGFFIVIDVLDEMLEIQRHSTPVNSDWFSQHALWRRRQQRWNNQHLTASLPPRFVHDLRRVISVNWWPHISWRLRWRVAQGID